MPSTVRLPPSCVAKPAPTKVRPPLRVVIPLPTIRVLVSAMVTLSLSVVTPVTSRECRVAKALVLNTPSTSSAKAPGEEPIPTRPLFRIHIFVAASAAESEVPNSRSASPTVPADTLFI